ncbi:type II toxin-antitoxin system VapB family antitoxin [Halomonas stenophila]|uniref:Arc/MetJ family transcription regulator n=1 Tax=Halomonas stenophila TaxID=795312 RepID=A0A7W5HLT3_9GAMM|nr:type II toxin-antitoxin system VapB family antitoxin [Halomonas stenophila]MBB3231927.1 Arc/MetJ family transcription regulator [Halomonas stenophila]
MPLQIEMLTDDEQAARICEDYWLQDEQGNFALKIKEIANCYGMQPQVVTKFVEQHALVWLDEILCSECKQPFHFGTRSQYQERHRFQNRVCASCLKPKHKTVAEKTNRLILEYNQKVVRTTVTIDEALYKQAMELSDPGVEKPSDLFREALKTYVRVQAARRLVALGGKAPDMQDIPRRGENSHENQN